MKLTAAEKRLLQNPDVLKAVKNTIKAARSKKPLTNANTDWTVVLKACPHCPPGTPKRPVVPDFGVRNTGRGIYAHSWCNKCRSHENYSRKPRKYKTA